MPHTQGQMAFAMSLGAGMSTGIGACFVLFTTGLNPTLLASTMGFSSGVMIYVSLVEVVAVASEHFQKSCSPELSYAFATMSFFVGALIMALVDKFVHYIFDLIAGADSGESATAASATTRDGDEDSKMLCSSSSKEEVKLTSSSKEELSEICEMHTDESASSIMAVAQIKERKRLLMMAAVVSAAIVLHNIPEGMATYVACFHSVTAGAPLAIAIAIHNIPEGLAVAMPVFYATRSRARAIGLGTLSGFSEPFGALLASFVANERSPDSVFGGMFGLTAGMMTFVCISELLPSAYAERGVSRTTVTLSFFLGAAVMASSLVAEKLALASSAR